MEQLESQIIAQEQTPGYRGLSVDSDDSGWMTETGKPNDEPVTYF